MEKINKLLNSNVEAVFFSYPAKFRKKLMALRQLIFDTAEKTAGVGELEESLKWGEPSYITAQTKSGSTIRIAWKRSKPHQYAIYFNCKTTLIETFRRMYGDLFEYDGNRGIIFNEHGKIPIHELSVCVAMALTYRLHKREST